MLVRCVEQSSFAAPTALACTEEEEKYFLKVFRDLKELGFQFGLSLHLSRGAHMDSGRIVD